MATPFPNASQNKFILFNQITPKEGMREKNLKPFITTANVGLKREFIGLQVQVLDKRRGSCEIIKQIELF